MHTQPEIQKQEYKMHSQCIRLLKKVWEYLMKPVLPDDPPLVLVEVHYDKASEQDLQLLYSRIEIYLLLGCQVQVIPLQQPSTPDTLAILSHFEKGQLISRVRLSIQEVNVVSRRLVSHLID